MPLPVEPRALAHRHASLAAENKSRHRPRRAFSTAHLPRRKTRRAQANSLARITSPIGMTMAAGPGRRSSASPTRTMVPPITATTILLIVGVRFSPSASVIRRRNAILCSTAMAEPCNSASGEVRELLLQLWRHVRHDHCIIPLIAQLEHVTDAMNFGDQGRLLGGNTKMQTQSPGAERFLQCPH